MLTTRGCEVVIRLGRDIDVLGVPHHHHDRGARQGRRRRARRGLRCKRERPDCEHSRSHRDARHSGDRTAGAEVPTAADHWRPNQSTLTKSPDPAVLNTKKASLAPVVVVVVVVAFTVSGWLRGLRLNGIGIRSCPCIPRPVHPHFHP